MLLPRRERPSEAPPLRGYVDPNIPNPNTDADAPIIIYGYTPTLALSALALALYSILFLLYTTHLFILRTRSRPFTILIFIATLLELLGYIFRTQSSPPPVGDPYKVINFVLQYFFIVVAPVFVSAGIYTVVTSLIRWLGEGEYTPLGMHRRSIVWIFVVCDVIATVVQVAGAALIGSAESNRKSPDTANNILLAGLAFQCASFLVFLVLFGIVLSKTWHLLTKPEFQQREKHGGEAKVKILGSLKRFVVATLVASLLVYLRTIFRLAETAQGVYGYASTHEAFFGALEFAPVVVAIAMMGVWHPGWFVGRGKERGGARVEQDGAENEGTGGDDGSNTEK